MIPAVPDGTDLSSFTGVLLSLRLLRSVSDSRACIVWRVRKTSDLTLKRLGPSEIALKFTNLSIGLSTLGPSERGVLLHRLSSKEPHVEIAKVLRQLMPKQARRVRRCPICVHEDVQTYGFALGRSLHQVQSIRTCAHHGVALENECHGCGAEFALPKPTSYRLGALHQCSRCGSTKGRSLAQMPSDGYRKYLDLLSQAASDDTHEYQSSSLDPMLDRFFELAVEHGVDLLPMFAKHWAFDSWREFSANIDLPTDELRRALLFGTLPSSVEARYALAGFFHKKIKDCHRLPSGRPTRPPRWNFKTPFGEDRFVPLRAFEFGLPMRVALMLLSGDWRSIRKFGCSIAEVRRFIAGLEGGVQLYLQARRAVHLRSRLSRLHPSGGVVSKPIRVVIIGLADCGKTRRIEHACFVLGIGSEVQVQHEVQPELPKVFVNGVRIDKPYDQYYFDHAIQRTQFWPRRNGVGGWWVPHTDHPFRARRLTS